MSVRYSLESVLSEAETAGVVGDDLRRVQWAYLDTLVAYEKRRPYEASKLPGIEGALLYDLNKRMVAYASASLETRRLIMQAKRNG